MRYLGAEVLNLEVIKFRESVETFDIHRRNTGIMDCDILWWEFGQVV
jgi:hypothetical protein